MLHIKVTHKSIRGSLAKQLLKIVQFIDPIKNHGPIHFGRIYTTHLSDEYKFPKRFESEWITYKSAKMERLSLKGKLSKNIILQLHGGAYVFGYNDMYRRSAIKYFDISCKTDVISLDYRIAPSHPFPAALEDAVAAYEYLITSGYTPQNIIIVGDSAGGGLALSLGLYLRDHHIELPKAIITMSAWTDLAAEGESYIRNQTLDPMLGKGTEALDVLAYASESRLKDPYVSPAYGKYENFTTLMMHVGTHEVLESDTLTVAKKASDAGNQVYLTMYRGMFHVFQLAFDLIPEAKKAWKEISDFIQNQFGCER
jgi:monoterpene epsilon-lactone hydrolase